jgi:ribonucleotide monophosphatase NagD (HAD superfamily)
MSLDNFEAY